MKYRVTYTDGRWREAIVEAEDAELAVDIAFEQRANGEHHHIIDNWNDHSQAEQYNHAPLVKRYCYECRE